MFDTATDWQTERLIYQTQDEFGDVLVKDLGLIRTLYFGDKKQSSVLLPNLNVLVLYYAQAMMTALLFNPRPAKVLLIGLGGGSFVHFLLKAFPDVQIEIVELRKSVIDVAHKYFALPKNNPNIKLYHMDAKEFVVLKANTSAAYDLLLIDAFDQWGPADILENREFLQQCRQIAGKKGVCCFNLWNRREDFYAKSLKKFKQIFDDNVYQLRLGRIDSNVILLGFAEKSTAQELQRLVPAAEQLKNTFGIDFPRYHQLMLRQNTTQSLRDWLEFFVRRIRETISKQL